jgi:hypothetical protein
MVRSDPSDVFAKTTAQRLTARQATRGLFHMLPTASSENAAFLRPPTLLLPDNPNELQQRRSLTYKRIWDEGAVSDLFDQYAQDRNGVRCLNCDDIRALLKGIGEIPKDATVSKLFAVADADNNGLIDLDEFLEHTDMFLGDNPARVILVVGG